MTGTTDAAAADCDMAMMLPLQLSRPAAVVDGDVTAGVCCGGMTTICDERGAFGEAEYLCAM